MVHKIPIMYHKNNNLPSHGELAKRIQYSKMLNLHALQAVVPT